MALLDLASFESFDCSKLVICVDRTVLVSSTSSIIRDLGWGGIQVDESGSVVRAEKHGQRAMAALGDGRVNRIKDRARWHCGMYH